MENTKFQSHILTMAGKCRFSMVIPTSDKIELGKFLAGTNSGIQVEMR